MSIAGCGHGKPPYLCVFKRVSVIATQGGSGIEDFERIDRQSFEGGKTDPGSEQIIWMGWDGEAAAGVNQIADFVSWPAFKLLGFGQHRSDTKQVPFGGGHLHARQNEKIVHW